ncbi:MAG: 50S ribosomal protein L18 [Candidatus Pacebacteria bacterium]|jgi:large subunit ribosomal protein L18|nr:50S ribosomal protein L18 [Candidatus Paceibacterota bacterium]
MSKLTPKSKTAQRERRHRRVRGTVSGTAERPRLAVFRSNKYVYAQLIDDDKGVTIVAASTIGGRNMSQMEQAKTVGTQIAKAAAEKRITKVVFDRGGFQYGGRIAALADAARAAGLQF